MYGAIAERSVTYHFLFMAMVGYAFADLPYGYAFTLESARQNFHTVAARHS